LSSRASIQSSSLNSGISPAIFTERSVVSKREIVLTPLLPSKTARQNAGLPIPLGLTAPIPVMTARLSIGSDSIIDAGFMLTRKPVSSVFRRKGALAGDAVKGNKNVTRYLHFGTLLPV